MNKMNLFNFRSSDDKHNIETMLRMLSDLQKQIDSLKPKSTDWACSCWIPEHGPVQHTEECKALVAAQAEIAGLKRALIRADTFRDHLIARLKESECRRL